MPTVRTMLALSGDVTTLNWISVSQPTTVETKLGFGHGRLAKGYWIAVLKERLEPDDFDFAGTKMRSGGRLGRPMKSCAADILRPRVHDQIMAESGAQGYGQLQRIALASVSIMGPYRIGRAT
jgi:hypothetical protein